MQTTLSSMPIPRRPDLVLVWGMVVAAWVVTMLLVATGGGEYIVNHDAVLERQRFAWPVTIALFLASWQLMTAAMMLPSSMPMMVMFLRVSRTGERRRLRFLTFLLGYFAVLAAFLFGWIKTPKEWDQALTALLGVITGSLTTIVAFWFSRSRQSES